MPSTALGTSRTLSGCHGGKVYTYARADGLHLCRVVSNYQPRQYGDVAGTAPGGPGFAWWTPEEDRLLLQMRIDGHTWGEIHAALAKLTGNPDRHGHAKRYPYQRGMVYPCKNRAEKLARWEATWGQRKPLPDDVKQLIKVYKKNKFAISAKCRLVGTRAANAAWRRPDVKARAIARIKATQAFLRGDSNA